jgi:hypothetical protein
VLILEHFKKYFIPKMKNSFKEFSWSKKNVTIIVALKKLPKICYVLKISSTVEVFIMIGVLIMFLKTLITMLGE